MQTSTRAKLVKGCRSKSKTSIHLNKLAPWSNIRCSAKKKLDTSDVVAEEIDERCEAMEEFNREAKEQPGFVMVDDEKSMNKGETKRPRTSAEGTWNQPRRGEQRRFGGCCSVCWRSGQQEAQSWFQDEEATDKDNFNEILSFQRRESEAGQALYARTPDPCSRRAARAHHDLLQRTTGTGVASRLARG